MTNLEYFKEVTKRDLQRLVDSFNEVYTKWSKETGCKANFGWRYTSAGDKILSIERIDLPVYSNEESMADQALAAEEILSKAATESISKS